MVAPAYEQESYIDHELSANLDSTFAFEGPEKLLEIWFWSSESNIPKNIKNDGLRSVPLEEWIKILDLVNCKILSMKSSKFMDAYLLSESSLFVFPHKIILKTCGTTTTLACLDHLFKSLNKFILKDFDNEFNLIESKSIFKIFYSRRSFMFPDKQKHVHRDWKHEVQLLNKFFINGKSYVVGDFMSDDHWYIYMGGSSTIEQDQEQEQEDECDINDQTLEMLMTDLNPEKAKVFFTTRKPGSESLIDNENEDEESDLGHEIGFETMNLTKLNSIFENDIDLTNQLPSPSLSDNMSFDESNNNNNGGKNNESNNNTNKFNKFDFIHDAFSFSPCGYSSNSISSNNGGYYYTLHITPESGWSYASFETNYPFENNDDVSIMEVIIKILKIFEPGKFSITLINEIKKNQGNGNNLGSGNGKVNGNGNGKDLEDDLLSLSSTSSFGSLSINKGKKINNGSEKFNELVNCDSILNKLGYKKHEKIIYDLKNEYNLLYLNFEKK